MDSAYISKQEAEYLLTQLQEVDMDLKVARVELLNYGQLTERFQSVMFNARDRLEALGARVGQLRDGETEKLRRY